MAGDGVDREAEPVVGVADDQVDQQQGGQVRAVRRVAADVDLRVLDLPPARQRRARVAAAGPGRR